MKRGVLCTLMGGLLLLVAVTTHAQSQCAALVERALALVAENCSATGRNQACHGYLHVDAEPRTDAPAFDFNIGQSADLSLISALQTSPFDELRGEWGVALLRVQANLPDELPGTNATFLLMGAASLENDDARASNPMQAVRLRTSLSGTSCSEAPTDGLLIQTPHGVGRVELTINGVGISLGSTVLFEARPGEQMTVSTLEGSAQVTAGGMTETALPGQSVSVPMTVSMDAAGAPGAPQPYDAEDMRNLPLDLLGRPVTLPGTQPPPATANQDPSGAEGGNNGDRPGNDSRGGNCGSGQGQGVANGCDGGNSSDSGGNSGASPGNNNGGGNCGNGQGQGVANGCDGGNSSDSGGNCGSGQGQGVANGCNGGNSSGR